MSLRIIGGAFKNRLLKSPKSTRTRPTLAVLRKAVFDILQEQILDADFLDCFAGTGAMGIEALSRGARHVTFIDKDRQAIECIRENLDQFHIEDRATILAMDTPQALKRLMIQKKSFNIIYVDPPYALLKTSDILNQFDTSCLLKDKALLLIEEGTPASPLPTLTHLRHLSTRQFSQSVLHEFIYTQTT